MTGTEGGGGRVEGRLGPAELAEAVAAGTVDTVVVAMTDMQGRLQGKRVDARFFLEEVAEHATEACDYLLAVDVEMNTVPGYALTSWERGYGDFVMKPDLGSLRVLPWHDRTVFCHADLSFEDGSPVEPSPRRILARQVERLADRGWTGLAGTELELIVFEESYEEAWRRGYRELTPANAYNVDYSILGTSRVEGLLGRIRREMRAAGMQVESLKGECNRGQHEIAFRYDELLAKADEHVVYKTGAKEIAASEGRAITFMAKFDEREGNSCHIHLSLRGPSGEPVLAAQDGRQLSETGRHVLAGLLATLGDFTLLLAPNVNSYKRFSPGSFAPTAVAWGRDNRTCAYRVVGEGPSLRLECRVPGGDVNPYLALAALVAGGLHGLEERLPLAEPVSGNAYTAELERLPATLGEAARRFTGSEVARAALGDEVVEHYANMAAVELAAFQSAVTDWERVRCFERL
ncbi:MAG TPA: glutamine synthetase family protein [Acidimicrobiales bacterium]|nr:glutamine synthetase family protein [Acidimicrobiales bacterium]